MNKLTKIQYGLLCLITTTILILSVGKASSLPNGYIVKGCYYYNDEWNENSYCLEYSVQDYTLISDNIISILHFNGDRELLEFHKITIENKAKSMVLNK